MEPVERSSKGVKLNDYDPPEDGQRQKSAVFMRLYRNFQNDPSKDGSLFACCLYSQRQGTVNYRTGVAAGSLARQALSESRKALENRRYDDAKEYAFQACLYSPYNAKAREQWTNLNLNLIHGGKDETAPVSRFYEVIQHELLFDIACFLDRRSMKNFSFTCLYLYSSLFQKTVTHLLNREAPIPRSFAGNYQGAPRMDVTRLDLSSLDFDLVQKAFRAIPNARYIKLFEKITDVQMEALVPFLGDCDTLHMEDAQLITNISPLVEKYPNNLRHLRLDFCVWFAGFEAIGNHCSKLQSLYAKQSPTSYASIEKITKNNPDLRSLTFNLQRDAIGDVGCLTDLKMHSILQNSKNITHLELSKIKISNEAVVEIAKAYNKNLNMFGFSLISVSVNSGLNEIAERCDNLQHLKILASNKTGDILDRLTWIAQKCKQLTAFEIALVPPINDAEFLKILINCTALQYLDVSARSYPNITDATIRAIIQKSNRWKTVAFENCEISDETLEEISNCCEYLETVNLDGCSSITANGLMKMIRKCHRLKDLNLAHDGDRESHLDINDGHLILIATHCEYLRKIHLSYYGSQHSFTLTGIKNFIALCGNLGWINLADTTFDEVLDDSDDDNNLDKILGAEL